MQDYCLLADAEDAGYFPRRLPACRPDQAIALAIGEPGEMSGLASPLSLDPAGAFESGDSDELGERQHVIGDRPARADGEAARPMGLADDVERDSEAVLEIVPPG